MYHNILVPISFDADRDVSGPLKLAELLATPTARVTLMHVVEHIPDYVISYMPTEYLTETRRAIQAELADMASRLPNASAEVIEGHSGKSILEWADANRADLIILASHRPGMQDIFLGSTATHVVRHAQCAVHVVR